MGAGKSSVGRALARVLNWNFLDLDDEICRKAGLSVPGIFDAHGEEYFREIEAQEVIRVLSRQHLVLALGGGALEADSSFQVIESASHTVLVFLRAPLSELLARCQHHGGGVQRPLLRDLREAEARYEKRLPRYQNAHLTVETSGSSAPGTASRIQQALSQLLR